MAVENFKIDRVATNDSYTAARSSFDENVVDLDDALQGNANQDAVPEAIDHFAHAHNLGQHIGVFCRAFAVLQGSTPFHLIPNMTPVEIHALEQEHQGRWHQTKMLYFTVLVCSMGAIEQGWAQTGMNGANLHFPQAFDIGSNSSHDTFVVGLINSAIYLSTGLVGAWSSDPINNRLGRRGAIFVGSVLCLLSNLGSSISQTWPQLLVFRLALGLGLAVNASTVSVYSAECAPSNIRGGLAVAWQMWTAFGIFLGFVANVILFNYGSMAWRFQLGAAFIPTIPLLSMVYVCPESPSWYIKSGDRYDLAFKSLCRLRNTELQAARDVYLTYSQRDAKSKRYQSTAPSLFRKLSELLTIPRNRRATTASYVVMLSQQLCGINIIAFYSSTIFSDSGFSMFGALLASCVFGFVNFIGAFPAVWTMDTLGRRSLLLLTLPLMAITMFAAGLSFSIPNENSAHLILLATFIYLFCAEYSPGMGPVPSAYTAEVFPLSHREVGMSMGVATANFWAAILSLTFPRLLSAWGPGLSFSLYAFLNLLALVLVFLFVPETRLKTLEELDGVFAVPTRKFVQYQTMEWLPWVVKRYVLRHKDAELMPMAVARAVEYVAVHQDEDEE